jgi:hypothetical protein
MTFNTKKLTGSRVVVEGTDLAGNSGTTVVSSAQWDEINQRGEFSQAQQAFDDAVEEFFAPLTEAAEKLANSVSRPTDSISYVVQQEEIVGQAAQPQVLVRLSHDSIVLRLIESGNTDRLVWVGDKLEVLEATPSSASGVTAASPVTGEDDSTVE